VEFSGTQRQRIVDKHVDIYPDISRAHIVQLTRGQVEAQKSKWTKVGTFSQVSAA
jgi:hypothetical protein